MIDLDIIESVQKPNNLVNGLFVVGKPNEKYEHLYLSTSIEIFLQVSWAS